ncbi:MAG: universal stress protein [Blastocatellia bacterium]|nr:universal stress protein [Chloracidobacterium sp.]MBL8183747.1 universal stress protein [Blastocatellia bacterium]HRJ87847.1 universal stress protein [Pyrinomonadaceae bacterium]HRK49990.1 universal stress protein [Pyrinomonadaceae bacterium]
MRILVAYDGSRCSEAAIDDLKRAGLPESGEASIISVAEVWLPPPNGNQDIHVTDDPYIVSLVQRHREKGERALTETKTFAAHAETRLRTMIPSWNITSSATYGSPAWEILSMADNFKPDLIVIGSHGQSAISRFFLGSISQKVLTEAHCSVRVARGRIEVDASPIRIVVGFDSSKGAQAAVEAVSARSWPAETAVRLIAVTDPVKPTAIGRFVPPIASAIDDVNDAEREWLEQLAQPELRKLEAVGLKASLHIVSGNPKTVLVEESEHWNADTIFVGANAFGSRLERFLIGSTSAAVAGRAHCSVEVVRTQA